MGLFARSAPPADAPAPVRAPLRVLRADGQRIDLTKRDSGQLLVSTRQEWAQQAFDYRDMIGELRYAIRLLSRSVARVRFYPAEQRPWPEDPIPLDGDDHTLDKQLAADAVYNFGRLPMDSNPDGFTARLVENLAIAGEAWVHMDPEEQFWVRSVSEVNSTADGRVTLISLPGTTHGTRVIDPATEDLMRLWVPHPEWAQLADSPMRSLLHTCEDVVIAGREQRAAARSRIASNGILLMPDSLSMPRIRDTEDDEYDDSVLSDTFMADLAESMLEPIRNEGNAGAVIPLVLRGDKDDIAAVKHLSLERADSKELLGRQSAAILRLLRGLDIQPEQVDGVGGMNHWSVWASDARAIRDQITPMSDTVAASLAAAYLRPAMKAVPTRHDPEQIRRITIGVDVSPLTENPNRSQDAMDAHGAGVISDEALRKAKGFEEDDAPSDEEQIKRLARDGRLPVEVSAQILGLRPPERETITVQGETVQPALPAARPAAQPGELHPAQTTPTPPVRTEPPGPVVAAATPDPADEWRVDPDASRRLADIDAALTEWAVTACDAAVQRVVERAGAKVRTATRNDKTITASLSGVDTHLIPSILGREQVESFTAIPDLIADSYTRLHAQLDERLSDAATQIGDAVCDVLGLDKRSGRGRDVHAATLSRLAAHHDRAWPLLAEALDEAAEDALFPSVDPDEQGETSTALISPQAVTDALAVAGGEAPALTAAGGYGGGRRRRHRRPVKRTGTSPTSGPATGPVVRDILAEQGAVTLGWEWHYRVQVPRQTFDPHKQLDGQRFLSWRDPILETDAATAWVGTHFHPKDHSGCLCTASIVVGTVADPESALAQALRDAHGDPSRVLAAGGQSTGAGLRERAMAAADAMRADQITNRKGRRS